MWPISFSATLPLSNVDFFHILGPIFVVLTIIFMSNDNNLYAFTFREMGVVKQ